MPERALQGLGCTAVNTVGVTRPRPCVRVFSWILGFTLGAHAVLLAHLWYASTASDSPRAARLTMRLVRPVSTQREPAAAVPTSTRTPAPAALRRPSKAAAKPSAQSQSQAHVQPTVPAATPAETAEAIVGIVFAPPRVGFPGAGAARSTAAPPPPIAAAPPSAFVAQMMQAQATREAGRSQVVDALQRTLAGALADANDGACALDAQPDASLSCDNESLMRLLAPREAALAGLLRAYRSVDPQASGIAIAVVQGRYQVAWNTGDALR
jgi:hypothetical protein